MAAISLALALVILNQPELSVDLNSITLAQARELDGRFVLTTFTVGCPAFNLNGTTVIGPGEQEDGIGRAVYLPESQADHAR